MKILATVLLGLSLVDAASTIVTQRQRITQEDAALCRCETNFEKLYARRLSEERELARYRIDYSDTRLDENGFYVVEGIRILPRDNPACSERHRRLPSRSSSSSSSSKRGKYSGSSSLSLFPCPGAPTAPETATPTAPPSAVPTPDLNRADECVENVVYGSCDRSSTSGLSDTCSEHTCADFSGAPFNMPATAGGFYNWTGGLPPQPMLMQDVEGSLLGHALVSPDCSICMIKTQGDLRVAKSACHIAPDFPRDENGTITKNPEFFEDQGCPASEAPTQCIIIVWAEIESPVCETDPPSMPPTTVPTSSPSSSPTLRPTDAPTFNPTEMPTTAPTNSPTEDPTNIPTNIPTLSPTAPPTDSPTLSPTDMPTDSPTAVPSRAPTSLPTTEAPTDSPTMAPTRICGDSAPNAIINIDGVGELTCTQVEVNQESCDLVDTLSNAFVKDVCQRECHFCKATCDNGDQDTVSFIAPGQPREINRSCEYVGANPNTCKLSDTGSPRDFLVEDTCQKECLSVCEVSCSNSPTWTVSVSPNGQLDAETVTCAFVATNQDLCSLSDQSRDGDRLVSSVCENECLRACIPPTQAPSPSPTQEPTSSPTPVPTQIPTVEPTNMPTMSPTVSPTNAPTRNPTSSPTSTPSTSPTFVPTPFPSQNPTRVCGDNSPEDVVNIADVGVVTCDWVESNSVFCASIDQSTDLSVRELCERECHNCAATCDNLITDTVEVMAGNTVVVRPCAFVAANPRLCTELDRSSPRMELVEDTCQKECLASCPDTCDNLPTATVSIVEAPGNPAVARTCSFVGENRQACSLIDQSRGGIVLVSSVCELQCLSECTASPTSTPTFSPTSSPTDSPTQSPTDVPTIAPTLTPTIAPTNPPTISPTTPPTPAPSASQTTTPSVSPTETPTVAPTRSCLDNSPEDVVSIDSVQRTCEWVEQNGATCTEIDGLTSGLVQDVCQQECHNCAATCSNDLSETVTIEQSVFIGPIERNCSFVGQNPGLCSLSDLSGGGNALVEDTCQKECLSFCPTSCDNLPSFTVAVVPFGGSLTNPEVRTCADIALDSAICNSIDQIRMGPVSSVCERECLETCKTSSPTVLPTLAPTSQPTTSPTLSPTVAPTRAPTVSPTVSPTAPPTASPTPIPTATPTLPPTSPPSAAPTPEPSSEPTGIPTSSPVEPIAVDCMNAPEDRVTFVSFSGSLSSYTCSYVGTFPQFCNEQDSSRSGRRVRDTCQLECVTTCPILCSNLATYRVKVTDTVGLPSSLRTCANISQNRRLCTAADESRPGGIVADTCQKECADSCQPETPVPTSPLTASPTNSPTPNPTVSPSSRPIQEIVTSSPTSSPVASIMTPAVVISKGKGKGKGKGAEDTSSSFRGKGKGKGKGGSMSSSNKSSSRSSSGKRSRYWW